MCDTFVALKSATVDGSVIFGKNSDREPNEAQSLEYHSAKNNEQKNLDCTYLTIPQIKTTYGILICRPFWMWGAEMGINEHGVTVGNEAVFTKMPLEKGNALTGMDCLRLALERSDSSIKALEVITELLADFGQGGICGYEDKNFAYHNSFIIADPKEAWVLETAGHLWVAKKVEDYYTISNGLTIGKEFDLSHPDLVPFARKKGWLKKGNTFHFADCYSDWFYTTFSRCALRRNRSGVLAGSAKKLDLYSAFSLLRDHGTEPYRPDSHFFMNQLCAHSANSIARHASQSVGSMVAHLSDNGFTAWVTGTSAPCTALFKPIDITDAQLLENKIPGKVFDADSLWWRHEKLHRSILQDYANRIKIIEREQREFEKTLINSFSTSTGAEKMDITLKAFKNADALTTKWLTKLNSSTPLSNMSWLYHRYWKKQNRTAQITL
ncbi:MAG: C69 family dipeptidase [Candidatus Marinimicrobia bacterium]|nr:C69 family dipeptidase [Candidatus Neomarinimicrobiota bacterium]